MTTLEVLNKAQYDGNTYVCDYFGGPCSYMYYNKKEGFRFSNGASATLEEEFTLNDFMCENCWSKKPENSYTKEEAERKFGIKIIGY